MDIVQRNRTQAFVTKDGSTIRELLAHRNSSISNQSLAEATVPPGVRTEPHYHAVSEEIYYILSGAGKVSVDGETRLVGPGDAIAIAPKSIHWIENSGDADLVFLCCCAPAYEHDDTFLQAAQETD